MSGGEDKTQAPTPKRKKEARKEGRVAKTNELGMWLQVLASTIGIEMTFNHALDGLRDFGRDISRISSDPDPELAISLLGRGLGLALTSVLPLAVMMMAIGTIALLAQTGLLFASKAAKPKMSKINPFTGIKRLFNPQGAWQGAKAVLKLAILAMFSWRPVLGITHDLLGAGRMPVFDTAAAVVATSTSLARNVAGVGIVLAVADYAFQRYQINKGLKMSKKEIIEEHKQAEGDPHVKGQIKQRQREMSRNRMLAGVADASVVIVNPTHIAVAIRYRSGSGAPRVVAKGRGIIADRIREEAAKHFVPIVKDVPLARTLERSCRIDQTIPPDLYEAVARLLAFVMQVGRKASLLGGVLVNPHAEVVAMPEPRFGDDPALV